VIKDRQWREMLAAEGAVLASVGGPQGDPASADDLPCPACGLAAPLVEGACSDCGLQLE
jgi:hypothetical protein